MIRAAAISLLLLVFLLCLHAAEAETYGPLPEEGLLALPPVEGDSDQIRLGERLLDCQDSVRAQSIAQGTQNALLVPANPNLLFRDDVTRTESKKVTEMRGVPSRYFSVSAPTVAAQTNFAYDTGFVGSGIELFPSTIALDGTDEARRRGHTELSAESTQLSINLTSSESGSFTSFVQLEFFDDVRLRIAQGQAALLDGTLYGGQTWTTFMDQYAVPYSIAPNTTSAGTVFSLQPQIGYLYPVGNHWSVSCSVEQGPTDDYTLIAASDERLYRYPDFVTRLHWASSNNSLTNSTFHLATLVRGLGLEDVSFDEIFATGWGVSLMGKVRPTGRDTFYAGFVGGEGIGSYIFGFDSPSGPVPADNMPAAGPDGTVFRAMRNVGAHLGYAHAWSEDAMTNFGYGYAEAENSADMPASAAERLQNTWVNQQLRLTEAFTFGVEYHYAIREVRDDTEGDNHRIMFVVQWLSAS